MHPVSDHEIFVRVVDRKGFTAAGRELRMSTAVVSSRIAKLEDRLGRKLLIRNTRDVSTTEEGEVYYDHCLRVISENADLERRFQEIKRHPAGSLRISAPIVLGRNYIAPLSPTFRALHPDVQIRLQLTDRVANLIDEDIDLAVRMGDPEDSSLISSSLAPDLQIACGSPAYFAQQGVPKSPEELKNHSCLLLRFPGSRRYFWRFGQPDGEIKNLMISGDLDSDSSEALIDWAVEGHGLIMISVWELYDHVVSGALKPVLLDYTVKGQAIHAIMPPRKPQPIKTTAFLDAVRATFRDHPACELTNTEKLHPFAAKP